MGVGSREVVHVAVTRAPSSRWVAQQLRNATPFGETPRSIIRDSDNKFIPEFDIVAEASGIHVLRTPVQAPKANAICERFLGSVRRECLDHVILLNERHAQRVLREYVDHFNSARPHQGIGQKVPKGSVVTDPSSRTGRVISFPGLKGLHHEYQWAA